jgi:CBS domain-containing protein
VLLRTRLGPEGPKEGSTLATVKGIMSTEILAVAPDSTIAETATVMGTRGVGSALVMEGDELVGIFTERDALRAVASDFGAAQHPVTQFMTRGPTTTSPDTTTREALDIMLKQGFRHLPVLEGERVIGMVSLRDLTASLERELGDE